MKKKLLALLFLAVPLYASSLTTRMGLTKPADGETGWGTTLRNNYDIVDSSAAILSANQTFTGTNIFSGAVTLPASMSLTTPSFTSPATISASGTPTLILNQTSGGPDGGLISFQTVGTERAYFKGTSSAWAIGASTNSSTASDRIVLSNQMASPGRITFNPNNQGYVLDPSSITFTPTSGISPILTWSNNLLALNTPFNFNNSAVITGAGSLNLQNASNNAIGQIFNNGSSTKATLEFTAADGIAFGNTSTISGSNFSIISPIGQTYELAVGTSTTAGVQDFAVTTTGITQPRILQPPSKTKAQLQALSLSTIGAGAIYYCSDCSTDGVVVSTGTGTGAFGRISARTTAIN